MKLVSAGLLMYRQNGPETEYLLVHQGAPFFKFKDAGAWTIPKGIVEPDENLLDAAQREFKEETGFIARGPFISLGSVEQRNNKTVHAWAFAGNIDPNEIKSNTFSTEWPPRSGRIQNFPEVDRGAFFTAKMAREKLNTHQIPFVDRLEEYLRQ